MLESSQNHLTGHPAKPLLVGHNIVTILCLYILQLLTNVYSHIDHLDN